MKYSLASSTWGDEELAAMQRVIASGMFTMGKEVEAFERAFAAWVGSRHAVMVNSGSSANLLMVAALMFRKERPLKRGDEVIVPAVSWSTTYHPLQQFGLHVKFVDVDADTLNFDLEQLASAISARTRVVLAVNLLGNPNQFDQLLALAARHQIIILEDNCESLGARFAGQQAGSFGQMGTFSSFFSHHMSTMEGGVVTTNDDELAQILICLRAHGWTRGLPRENLVCGTKSDDPFEESFRFVLPGYNVRPLELSGAIGQEQLKRLSQFIATRRENASRFQELFAQHPWLRIQREIGESSWFGFAFVLKEGAPVTRKRLVAALASAGIEVRPIVAGNFAKNEVLKWYDYSVHGELKNADTVDRSGFFVGNHHYPLGEQLAYLRRTVEAVG